jgi:serine/threonine protein kinase
MARADADRNLLFGILALHNGFISRDALIRAMSIWITEKQTPLGEILVRQGDLSPEFHFMMEALVQAHLKQHGDDPEASLAALSTTALARVLLEEFGDADLRTSLNPSARAEGPTAPGEDGDSPPPLAAAALGEASSTGRRFRILRPHAEGGLGAVFVARDEELNREVALKQIKERYCTDPDSRSRFVAEAEITGGLEHPGVVPVYGLGRDDRDRPFYAMRFVRGDSLKEAIDRFHRAEGPSRDPGERALELRKLLGRFIDVCQAVGYAHSRGVIHRDVKPANILLGPYGETLVVDWGLAKAVGRDERASAAHPEEGTLRPSSGSGGAATLPGLPLGTPAYMSPEQAAGELGRIGPVSDVYSLGATLYSLLTGRTPFDGLDGREVMDRVRRGEFPPPCSVQPEVPRGLEAVCLKAMALKPEDRYATPLVLAEEIEHWLADEPVSAYPEPLALRSRRWLRRHRTLVTTAAAVLVLGLGGLAASRRWLRRRTGSWIIGTSSSTSSGRWRRTRRPRRGSRRVRPRRCWGSSRRRCWPRRGPRTRRVAWGSRRRSAWRWTRPSRRSRRPSPASPRWRHRSATRWEPATITSASRRWRSANWSAPWRCAAKP